MSFSLLLWFLRKFRAVPFQTGFRFEIFFARMVDRRIGANALERDSGTGTGTPYPLLLVGWYFSELSFAENFC
jgi:hypothetical protein